MGRVADSSSRGDNLSLSSRPRSAKLPVLVRGRGRAIILHPCPQQRARPAYPAFPAGWPWPKAEAGPLSTPVVWRGLSCPCLAGHSGACTPVAGLSHPKAPPGGVQSLGKRPFVAAGPERKKPGLSRAFASFRQGTGQFPSTVQRCERAASLSQASCAASRVRPEKFASHPLGVLPTRRVALFRTALS